MTAVRDLTPDLQSYLDTVHCLSDRGAVVTHVLRTEPRQKASTPSGG